MPADYFAILLAFIVALGAWEWARLAGCSSRLSRIAYVCLVVAIVIALFLVDVKSRAIFLILSAALLWWFIAVVMLFSYSGSTVLSASSGEGHADSDSLSRKLAKTVIGVLLLVPLWLSLVTLRDGYDSGPELVIFLMLLVWAADIGAYFAGKQWGNRKLAPAISPGKTIEGVAGGVLFAMLVATAGAFYFNLQGTTLFIFLTLCLVTVVLSVCGDLVESMFKRQAGVKDSSQLLPGHGGVLDRVDSLTAAAPVFMFGLVLLEIMQ